MAKISNDKATTGKQYRPQHNGPYDNREIIEKSMAEYVESPLSVYGYVGQMVYSKVDKKHYVVTELDDPENNDIPSKIKSYSVLSDEMFKRIVLETSNFPEDPEPNAIYFVPKNSLEYKYTEQIWSNGSFLVISLTDRTTVDITNKIRSFVSELPALTSGETGKIYVKQNGSLYEEYIFVEKPKKQFIKISSTIIDISTYSNISVDKLPESGETEKIYITKEVIGDNLYDEFIYIPEISRWERLGSTDMDLTGVVTDEMGDHYEEGAFYLRKDGEWWPITIEADDENESGILTFQDRDYELKQKDFTQYINKPSFKNTTITYDGDTKPVTSFYTINHNPSDFDGNTLVVKMVDSNGIDVTSTGIKYAGTYTLTIDPYVGDKFHQYGWAESQVTSPTVTKRQKLTQTIEITKRPVTIKTIGTTKTYDGQSVLGTYEISSGSFVPGEEMSVAISSSAVTDVTVSTGVDVTYTATPHLGFEQKHYNDNYDITSVLGKIIVNKRYVRPVSDGYNDEYDNQIHEFPAVNMFIGSYNGNTYQRWVDGEEPTSITATGSVKDVTSGVTNTISITWKDGVKQSNYQVDKSEGKLIVTKRALTVTTGSIKASVAPTYDGDNHSVNGVDVTYTNKTNLTYSRIDSDPVFTCVHDDFIDAGTHINTYVMSTVDSSGYVSSNYDIKSNPGAIVIKQKKIEFITKNETCYYNGTEQVSDRKVYFKVDGGTETLLTADDHPGVKAYLYSATSPEIKQTGYTAGISKTITVVAPTTVPGWNSNNFNIVSSNIGKFIVNKNTCTLSWTKAVSTGDSITVGDKLNEFVGVSKSFSHPISANYEPTIIYRINNSAVTSDTTIDEIGTGSITLTASINDTTNFIQSPTSLNRTIKINPMKVYFGTFMTQTAENSDELKTSAITSFTNWLNYDKTQNNGNDWYVGKTDLDIASTTKMYLPAFEETSLIASISNKNSKVYTISEPLSAVGSVYNFLNIMILIPESTMVTDAGTGVTSKVNENLYMMKYNDGSLENPTSAVYGYYNNGEVTINNKKYRLFVKTDDIIAEDSYSYSMVFGIN